jgi:predicted XRE-type DNA-binding protein
LYVRAKRQANRQQRRPFGVFYDLGFDEAEARVLAMRADLMAALREHIKGRGWTQSKAAKELGITQPRVSALMKGAWRDFSADMLLVLASRVGLQPTLKLAPDHPGR